MSEALFYFDFYDESNGHQRIVGFHVANLPDTEWEKIEKTVCEHTYSLEMEYGIHDWSSSPSEGTNAIGYTSYEIVDKNLQNELMEKWKYVFSTEYPECVVSTNCELVAADMTTDERIMAVVKHRLGV